MERENLNSRESLALIAEVISQTKDNFKQHSFVFLIWGWALAVASVARFVLQTQTDVRYYFIPFPVLAGVALVLTLIFYRRHSANARLSETHLNFFLRKLWLVLILGFIAIVFVSVYQHIEPFTYTLILAGVGTYLTGMMMKFKPFLIGGIAFLAASVVCVFVADEYKVLVHGIAVTVGYIIPGHMLKNATL